MPWIWLILAALTAVGLASASSASAKPKLYRPAYWPKGWPTPPAEFLTAVDSATQKYKVKAADLVVLGYIESGFNPRPKHKPRPKTWAKIKDKEIGKSGKKWSQVYTESDCFAYGIMGVMPFNFVGVPGGLPVGASLIRGENITLNVHMAARLLRVLYDKTGDWVSTIHYYNPGGGDEYYQRYRRARAQFDAARSTT
jgi:hypothetical protein